MLVKDLNLEYDFWSLQRRLEEDLTFTRSLCTDMLEIIHKPVENWDLDRLWQLYHQMDEEAFRVYEVADRLIDAANEGRG